MLRARPPPWPTQTRTPRRPRAPSRATGLRHDRRYHGDVGATCQAGGEHAFGERSLREIHWPGPRRSAIERRPWSTSPTTMRTSGPRSSRLIITTPSPMGPAPAMTTDSTLHLPCTIDRVTRGAHHVEEERGFGGFQVGVNGEKVGLVDQLIGAVAAVLRETHVAALCVALVGQAQPARPTAAAVVHEKHHTEGACRGRRAGAAGRDHTCRLVTGYDVAPGFPLASVGATDRIRPDLEQELAVTRRWHAALDGGDRTSSHETGGDEVRWQRVPASPGRLAGGHRRPPAGQGGHQGEPSQRRSVDRVKRHQAAR